jgi:hypothetical protein
MTSSSDSYQGPISSPVGPAIPGLPVAGKDSTIGDPYEYGKFQNFLPEAKGSGPNDMATGLRPEMFEYRKPNTLRDQLATMIDAPQVPAAGPPAATPPPSGDAGGYTPRYLPDGSLDQQDPGNIAQYYRLMMGGR